MMGIPREALAAAAVYMLVNNYWGPVYAGVAAMIVFQLMRSNAGPMVEDWKRVQHPDAKCTVDEMKGFVKSKSKGQLVVMDFYATWCPPCRTLAPKLADLSEEHAEVTFVGINADEHPSLRQEYGISCYPTVKFFKDNVLVDSVQGADVNRIVTTIQAHK
eukprot:TRINITY_DN6242_c0_g3_i2.p2 TRINITY_DN6242_c0_g3~~TRINITY_DN6242_c0_g3_i2.p2  ORF type:complete len:179 (+),score=50.38 TRINITY_DN6242_c0_g3_i2:59-538(+)